MKPKQNTQSNLILGDCASGAVHSDPESDLSITVGARAKTKHLGDSRSGSMVKAPQGQFVFYSQVIIGSFVAFNSIAHSMNLSQLPYSILGGQLFLLFISYHPHLSKDVAGMASRFLRR